MAFELPDLPYAHDALANFGMSAETLEYHHDLHHNAYVVNGNNLIAGTEWEGKSLEDIITGTYDSKAVAQNGISNHSVQLTRLKMRSRQRVQASLVLAGAGL